MKHGSDHRLDDPGEAGGGVRLGSEPQLGGDGSRVPSVRPPPRPDLLGASGVGPYGIPCMTGGRLPARRGELWLCADLAARAPGPGWRPQN